MQGQQHTQTTKNITWLKYLLLCCQLVQSYSYQRPGVEGCLTRSFIQESGFLDYIKPGDVFRADRGFNVSDEITVRRAT